MPTYPLPPFPILIWDAEELGRIIRRTRKARGIKQEELSHQTGISRWLISRIENGKEIVQMHKVLLLLRLLDIGVSLVDLQKRED